MSAFYGGASNLPHFRSLAPVVDVGAGDVVGDGATGRISAIYLFPIKSCAGMKVSTWPLDSG
jgi:hypothetical protein